MKPLGHRRIHPFQILHLEIVLALDVFVHHFNQTFSMQHVKSWVIRGGLVEAKNLVAWRHHHLFAFDKAMVVHIEIGNEGVAF